MNDNLSNSNNGNRNSLPNNNMDIFYAQSNHNPEMHKYIFQGSEYIGQIDFGAQLK